MAEYTLKIKKIKTPTDANWVTTIPTEYTNIKGRVYNIVKVEDGGKSKYDKNGYWQATADLMGLINPFTNPISSKPVTETKIELVYKDIYGWEEGTSEKMYFDFLADQCVKKMQKRYKELYGVDIDLSYIKAVEEKKVDDIPPTELSLKYISHVGGEEVKKVTFEVYESVNGNLTLLAEIKDFTAFEIDKTTKKISAKLLDIDERYYASNKLETWLEKNRDKLPKDTKYVLGEYPVEEKKDIKTETKTADNKVVDNNAVSLEGEFTFDVQEENLFKGVNNQFKELEIIGVGEIKETPIGEPVDETIDEEIDEEYLEDIFLGDEEKQSFDLYITHISENIDITPAEKVEIAKEIDKYKPGKPSETPPDDIVKAMKEYGIKTALEKAHFLAQCAHESGGFAWKREFASGKAYEGRCKGPGGLGNCSPGDGVKYKGRGYIQITGKANYIKYNEYLISKGIKDDVVTNPTLLEGKYAADCSVWYWAVLGPEGVKDFPKKANEGATEAIVTKISQWVNGGNNGLADRKAKFNYYWSVLQKTPTSYS